MLSEIEDVDRLKAFAVHVLAQDWAGVELPDAMIAYALEVKARMELDGTWLSS